MVVVVAIAAGADHLADQTQALSVNDCCRPTLASLDNPESAAGSITLVGMDNQQLLWFVLAFSGAFVSGSQISGPVQYRSPEKRHYGHVGRGRVAIHAR
jgi:hypothetical protein